MQDPWIKDNMRRGNVIGDAYNIGWEEISLMWIISEGAEIVSPEETQDEFQEV